MKRTSQALAWVMTVAMAVAFAAPTQVMAFESRGNTSSAKWVAQTPGAASGGATVINAAGGDILNFSLTVQNTSRTDVFYSADALLDEVAPYVGAHELRIGATDDTVYDNIFDFTYGGPFVNNNRFATFQSGDAVYPGQNLTFNWALKVKAGIADGTYRYRVGMVQEYDAWLGDKPGPGAGGPNNNLGGRSGGTIFWDIVVGSGSSTPATGGLSVSMASGTPVAGQIANNANTNFTKVTLTPASGATVSVTSLYVTRSGLSTDSAVQNVKLIRASDGVQVGNTAGGFNANHKAQIFFSPAMSISSPTDFYLRAGIVSSTVTAPAGNTVALGIAANSDIMSNATSVSGAPVVGNQMTIVNITVGTITLAQYGAVADSTPDAGDTDVTLNTFQLTAGSTEDMIVEQITVMKAGTANSTDTNNIELVNDSTGISVATVASWNSENKAVFNFSPALTIGKGNTVRFTVRIDIVSGSGLTVNADIVDGSDGLIVAKGALYGYYINPTVSGSWAGTPTASQTINSGALVISKASSTAPTGSIAIADNQNLGTWTFEARGEDILVTALYGDLVIGQIAGTPDASDVTNARLYDEAGNIVLGPIDGDTTDAGTGDGELDFTSSFIIPVGIHNYTLKVRIGTDFAGTDTIYARILANGDITARTIRTNTALAAGTTIIGAAATLNTMTVKAVALTATTLLTPPQQSIAVGIQDHIFMTGVFSASGSGEDVRITGAPFQVTTTNQADLDALVNMEVWADLTAANSSRGDKYETKITNTEQPAGTAAAAATVDYSWTFTTPLTVPKDGSIEIAFIGDIIGGIFTVAGSNDTFYVEFDEDGSPTVTAAGVDTGTDPACTPATVTSKTRTIEPAGAVTITVDSSSPQSDIVVGGSTGRTIAVYRAVTTSVEAVELDRFKVTNGSTGDENTGTWYLYSNRDASGNLVTPFVVATAANGATMTFNVPDNTTKIPADSVALLTVKTDILPVDGTTVQNGDTVDTNIADLTNEAGDGVTLDTDIDFTGKASGSTVPGTGTDAITNADHELYKSRPYVSFAADTPSGPLTPTAAGSVTGLIAKINITADAAFDIAFTNDDASHDATDSSIVISLNVVVNDDGVDSGGYSFVDLSTATVVDSATTDLEAGADEICDFSTADMFIGAGLTKTLAVYADTQAFEDTGDSLQVWLSDAADGNFQFGTTITADSAANGYNVGTIVLRGDKFGGTLVKA
ncbi:MAG: hypothetical protein PHR51_01230 [Patescibacteria group bacterium]|nr:hypothetical protein [Patescibacteria group bacterium]